MPGSALMLAGAYENGQLTDPTVPPPPRFLSWFHPATLALSSAQTTGAFVESDKFVGLLEQREDALLRLIGLSQHCHRSLLNNLRLGEVCGLGCVIGVHDAASCR